MENPSNLQQNYVYLLVKMEDLKLYRDQVARRGGIAMDEWLQKVKGREDEVGKVLNELNTGSGSRSLVRKNNLNKKVLANLKAVEHLKEVVNARFENVSTHLSKLADRYLHGDIKSFISKFPKFIRSSDDGDVYEGQFQDGKQVAVRVLPQEHVADDIFITEVSTISRASHRHVVKLYGFCFEGNMRALVYEYMENGSLDKILYQNHLSSLEWEKLYIIAIETAKGLAYMHEGCGEQIIHHDIWAGNVLLDKNLSPKVTGFGLSKLLKRDVTHCTLTRFKGAPGYAAPEMWELASRITNKCDVYSFGMMLFEILRKRRNTDGRKWFPKVVWEKFKNGQLDQIMRECRISEKDSEKAHILCTVALWCAQNTPEIRPSMSDVVMVLKNQMQVLSPPDPFQPQPLEYMMLPSQEAIQRTSPTIDESLHQTSFSKRAGKCASSSPLAQPLKSTPVDLNGVKYTVDSDTSNVPRNSKAIEILEQFEKKCPPDGANSVIIYTSTIEQMKRPFKESNEVRSILQSHNIQIIERDVWGDLEYEDELKDLMGGIVIPVVFVEGRLIGGAKEVKTLEAEGKLKFLFDGIPNY